MPFTLIPSRLLPLVTRCLYPVQAAPEMLMGEDPTPAADIYSLGIVLWELCTGELPRRGQRRVPAPHEAPMVRRQCIRFPFSGQVSC